MTEQTGDICLYSLRELLCSFFLCRRLSSEFRGLMGTVRRGRVLELWLLGPDVVVEPGEKLADTKAAKRREICMKSKALAEGFIF